ncbi:MAG: hypothetical protein Q9168_002115 [Polycauliona sp. 1 TL-2023]
MPSRSPDKKRLVSRPLSPTHKRRKSSVDDDLDGLPDVTPAAHTRGRSAVDRQNPSTSSTDPKREDTVDDIRLGAKAAASAISLEISTTNSNSQSPSPTGLLCRETDVTDKASSRSHSLSFHSESVRSEWLARQKTIREGKRPERRSPSPSDSGLRSPRPELPESEASDDTSVGDASSGRPGPSADPRRRVVSNKSVSSDSPSLESSSGEEPRRCMVSKKSVSSDEPSLESSSGDSLLRRFLDEIDKAHADLDRMDDEHSSLDQATWSSSVRASSHDGVDGRCIERYTYDVETSTLDDAGAGPSRRKFSYELEPGVPFPRSSCPSPSPRSKDSLGAHPNFETGTVSALDVAQVRSRATEPPEPTKPSGVESRDVSPLSKLRPNWRDSKRVPAGVITGSMRLERARPSSVYSDGEGYQSAASMKLRSSSISSIATYSALSCSHELSEQLSEALDTDLSTCYNAAAMNGKTLTYVADADTPGLPYIEAVPTGAGSAATAMDTPTRDIDHNNEKGGSNALAVAHNIPINDVSCTTNQDNQDGERRFEPFPNLTEDELRYITPVWDRYGEFHTSDQARSGEQLFVGRVRRRHDHRKHGDEHSGSSENTTGGDIDETFADASSIDPSHQDGVSKRNCSIRSRSSQSTLKRQNPSRVSQGPARRRSRKTMKQNPRKQSSFGVDNSIRSQPGDRVSSRPQSTSGDLPEAPSVDPSYQAGVQSKSMSIKTDTSDPTPNPLEGKSSARSQSTSNAGAWTGQTLVVGMSNPAHLTAADEQKPMEKDTLKSSPLVNLRTVGTGGMFASRSEAHDIMEAQKAVRRNLSARPAAWDEQPYDGARDQQTPERTGLMDESTLQTPRMMYLDSDSAESSPECVVCICLGKCFYCRKSRGGSVPASPVPKRR